MDKSLNLDNFEEKYSEILLKMWKNVKKANLELIQQFMSLLKQYQLGSLIHQGDSKHSKQKEIFSVDVDSLTHFLAQNRKKKFKLAISVDIGKAQDFYRGENGDRYDLLSIKTKKKPKVLDFDNISSKKPPKTPNLDQNFMKDFKFKEQSRLGRLSRRIHGSYSENAKISPKNGKSKSMKMSLLSISYIQSKNLSICQKKQVFKEKRSQSLNPNQSSLLRDFKSRNRDKNSLKKSEGKNPRMKSADLLKKFVATFDSRKGPISKNRSIASSSYLTSKKSTYFATGDKFDQNRSGKFDQLREKIFKKNRAYSIQTGETDAFSLSQMYATPGGLIKSKKKFVFTSGSKNRANNQ